MLCDNTVTINHVILVIIAYCKCILCPAVRACGRQKSTQTHRRKLYSGNLMLNALLRYSQLGRIFNIYLDFMKGLWRFFFFGGLINKIICLFSQIKSPRTVTETKRIFTLTYALGDQVLLFFIFRLAALYFARPPIAVLPQRALRRSRASYGDSSSLWCALITHCCGGQWDAALCSLPTAVFTPLEETRGWHTYMLLPRVLKHTSRSSNAHWRTAFDCWRFRLILRTKHPYKTYSATQRGNWIGQTQSNQKQKNEQVSEKPENNNLFTRRTEEWPRVDLRAHGRKVALLSFKCKHTRWPFFLN